MPGPHPRPSFAVLLIAGTVLLAGTAPAQAGAGDIYGKVTNRYGETKFTIRGATLATITLSAKVGATSRRKQFTLSCRTARGKYENIVTILPLSNQRRLSAPMELGLDPAVCRVERGSTVIATMRVRPL